MLRGLLTAVALLTTIPVARVFHVRPEEIGRATAFFPIVGAALGTLSAAALWVVTMLFEAPLLAAVGTVGIGAGFTGALHLDGLADTADGFGSARSRADTLRIMRDPSVGTYGVVALTLVLATKIVALATLVERDNGLAFLVVAPVLARWAIVPLAFFLSYAHREGGLGATVVGSVRVVDFVGATLLSAIVVGGLTGWKGLVCGVAVSGLSVLSGWRCKRRLGGVTGDTLGANTEIAELATFVTAIAMT